jgi:hypothetical protein
MAATQLENVISEAASALADWNSFIVRLTELEDPNRVSFDLDKTIPNSSPQISVKQLEAKLTGAISLVHTLSSIESVDLIPDSTIAELIARTAALKAAVGKLLTHINVLDKDSEIASLDATNFTATNQKGQQINLPPLFAELYPVVQNVLITLYQMRTMASLNEEKGFSFELSDINAVRSAQRRAYGDLNRLRRTIDAGRRRIDADVAVLKLAEKDIEAIKTQAVEAVKKTEENKTKSEAVNAAINEINTAAGKLKENVDAYQAAYTKFQADLDTRNGTFEKGKADIDKLLMDGKGSHDKLILDITEAQKEIKRLLDRSREVLGEATVSGLSESYAREMKKAKGQLLRIQILFFFSIVFLMASAGVVLNAFPWLEQWVHMPAFEPPPKTDLLTIGVLYLGNFVSKLTFLAPSLILLFFAARRYTEMFRLKTQYTYKYTVAASIPGFKVEAPSYAEAITASAFKELLFNPGETVEAPEDKPDGKGNTFLQRLIEPAVHKVIDKMTDIAKPPA